jgi:hypothetical protein
MHFLVLDKYFMRFYEFANQPIQPAVAQPVTARAPQQTQVQKLKAVQHRKINRLIQQRAKSELQQQAKVTEYDVVLAMQTAADLRRSGL